MGCRLRLGVGLLGGIENGIRREGDVGGKKKQTRGVEGWSEGTAWRYVVGEEGRLVMVQTGNITARSVGVF